MSNLFRFWSFFLREHFNRNIYLEFKNLAIEDHRGGSRFVFGPQRLASGLRLAKTCDLLSRRCLR